MKGEGIKIYSEESISCVQRGFNLLLRSESEGGSGGSNESESDFPLCCERPTGQTGRVRVRGLK